MEGGYLFLRLEPGTSPESIRIRLGFDGALPWFRLLRACRGSQPSRARFVSNANMSFRASHGSPNTKRGRTPPPEETYEEASFLRALGEKQKPVSVKLMDGQVVQGWIEY